MGKIAGLLIVIGPFLFTSCGPTRYVETLDKRRKCSSGSPGFNNYLSLIENFITKNY